jgi:hypothetical protein
MGVFTLTFLAVRAAPLVMAQLALTVVAVADVIVQVTPPPVTVIAVAPFRLVPVSVTGTVVPCVPVAGATEASVGPSTVKVMVAFPPGVNTVTVLAEAVRVVFIVRFTVIVVEETTVTVPTVTPPPFISTLVPFVVKLEPMIVTGTVVPRTPELGVIDDTVGDGGLFTVNVKALVSPFGVLTMTGLGLGTAVGETVKVAVTVESFTTVNELTVTPAPAVTAVAPVRPEPEMVTGTMVPSTPAAGVIEVNAGITV